MSQFPQGPFNLVTGLLHAFAPDQGPDRVVIPSTAFDLVAQLLERMDFSARALS